MPVLPGALELGVSPPDVSSITPSCRWPGPMANGVAARKLRQRLGRPVPESLRSESNEQARGSVDAAPLASMPMSIARVGIVGSGIMGSGIAETAAVSGFEVVLRSRSQSTADATVAALEKSLNRQVEKGKRTEDERDQALARVTATSELDRPEGRRPGHRVGHRGPGGEEGALQRARPDHRRDDHPGHQHLDPAGHRAGHADGPARQGLRRPLLQPGPGDGAGRGGPAPDRLRRDHRRRPRLRRGVRQDAGRGEGPGRASS